MREHDKRLPFCLMKVNLGKLKTNLGKLKTKEEHEMRKHVKLLKKEKGMTLIELLAVIIIIAIILAIVIPIIANVIGQSRDRAAVSEALNIISAAKLKYAQDGSQEDAAKYGANELKDYIDFKTEDNNFTVSFDGTTWSISGHPANRVKDVGDPANEGKLRTFLNKVSKKNN
ncbi:MAG: prepilin-type cleavage/methylation domain-containing protein [Bacillaceae bacterium]|nr:MAG: prepilin-type cleavage/methylation domain-containing protein [Bacillaceae bacterium]